MNDFLYINHANDYALDVGAEVFHPMVSVVHFDELGEIRHSLNKMGVYAIFVQDNFPVGSSYGMGGYDTTKGSLTAAAPGQVIGKADDGHREVYHGWALLFDAEFMRGTAFEERLTDYHFFSVCACRLFQVLVEERHDLRPLLLHKLHSWHHFL